MTTEAGSPAQRVFLHVGVPKSGTSFIQATLRANADRLRAAGLNFPTQQHRGLFHAALELTGNQPGWEVPERRVKGSWAGLCREASRFPGTSVFSQELFSNVESGGIPAALSRLEGMEVHLVVTARDLARQLPAEWQEGVKHGRTLDFQRFLRRILDPERKHDHARKFWRHQDLAAILERWGAYLPAERIHVVTCPPSGAPRDLLWRRFCAVVGVDPEIAEFPDVGANTSLGVTAVDVLRRTNRELKRGETAPQLRRTVKQVLVNGVLRKDTSDRVRTPDELIPRLQEITEDWRRRIGAAGYDVVGDLDDLTPLPAPSGVEPHHRVRPRESRDLAVQAVAALTRQVATLRAENQELERLRRRVAELESGPARGRAAVRRALARLRRQEA